MKWPETGTFPTGRRISFGGKYGADGIGISNRKYKSTRKVVRKEMKMVWALHLPITYLGDIKNIGVLQLRGLEQYYIDKSGKSKTNSK